MRWAMIAVTLFISCPCIFSQNPDDVFFRISTVRKPAVYHIGERVEIKLAFSTAHPGRYGIEYGYGFPGHPKEAYTLTPAEGAENPRVDPGQLGFIMVGSILGEYDRLGRRSLPIAADLNERLRFKKPGRYRFHAVSSRISYFTKGEKRKAFQGDFQLRSNEVELTILPADKDWLAHELEAINRLFDSPDGGTQVMAARRLRYLNAREAVPEMARRLPGSLNQQYHAELYDGLRESCWSDQVIANLQETGRNPERFVGDDTVELLATVILQNEYKNKPLPTANPNDPEQRKVLQSALEERRKRFGTLLAQYSFELSKSVPARRGRSRADTVFALWKAAEVHGPSGPLASPELPCLRQEIVSVANNLSPDQLYWLLSKSYWERLPKTKLLPVVEKLAAAPQPIKAGLPVQDLRGTAAARWCELDAAHCTNIPQSNR